MRKILNKLKKCEEKILLGLSGGVDSHVLFELCLRSGVDFAVAHIDHNLRLDSGEDADFVRNLCEQNSVKCFLISAPVGDFAKQWKTGLEDAGRRVRRQVFAQIAQENGYKKILLAHHQDDQLETILLNLKRGCGWHGLVGMQEFSEIFWRPMLEISRADILDFAHKNKLEWREDASNQSRKFLRNKVRHDLLPELEKTDPSFRKNLLKISREAQKKTSREKILVEKFLGQKDFVRQDFLALGAEMRGEVLRGLWIKLHGSVEGFERVRALEVEKLIERNIGRKKIKFGKFWLELFQGKLYFSKV